MARSRASRADRPLPPQPAVRRAPRARGARREDVAGRRSGPSRAPRTTGSASPGTPAPAAGSPHRGRRRRRRRASRTRARPGRRWPLLAEPSSGSRTGPNAIRTYRLLLDGFADRIERVVVFGHPTLSRPVTRLLARDDIEIVAVGDPWTRLERPVGRVLPAVSADPDDPAWLGEWRARDAEVSRGLDALIDGTEFGGHAVARTVSRSLPPGGLLFVGSSNPIRDLDLNVATYRVGDRRMVLANRGLAGIDGTLSSAIGAALGRPHSTRALALVGDVTFLHDTAGLVLGPDEPRPDLTIVVVNDDGGLDLLAAGAGRRGVRRQSRAHLRHAAPHRHRLAVRGLPVAAPEGAQRRGAGGRAAVAQRRHRGRRGGRLARRPPRLRRPSPPPRLRLATGPAPSLSKTPGTNPFGGSAWQPSASAAAGTGRPARPLRTVRGQ